MSSHRVPSEGASIGQTASAARRQVHRRARADAVGDLLGFDRLDGRARSGEGRSFFTRTAPARSSSRRDSLRSDPTDATRARRIQLRPRRFALEPATWIDQGTIRALRYSRYWAAKQSKKPTGYYNTFHLAGGQADGVDALVKKVDKGLLVTRFWYTRWLDPRSLLVTGLTRDGVFLIEKGQITHPVNNFRFNESPAHMLAKCTDLEKATHRIASGWYEVLRVPAILTHEFEMSSVSAAV
jgi:hypothetical protein